MKRGKCFTMVIIVLGLIIPNLSYSLELFDDFSETSIDLNRWREGKVVREIRDFGGDGKLLLARTNPSPVTISSYSNASEHHLVFVDPNSINSYQADVTHLESGVTGSGSARARLGGRWFNDGTPGGGYNGDIWAEVSLYGTYGWWYVGRHTSSSSTTQLGAGNFTQPITPGATYTLYIAYDEGNNQFTFRISTGTGTETITFGHGDGLPDRVGGPNNPWKALTARTIINNASSSSFISATFDNVYKNGSLYDEFSALAIDQTKWSTYELATEISGGKLRSKARTASTSRVNNLLEMTYPLGIKAIQVQVTPIVYENPQGLFEVADISGTFFNDGTAGSGLMGDVVGQVYIGGNGTGPIAGWQVYKYLDSAGNTIQVLDQGVFNTSIVLGNTYTLFLRWGDGKFSFGLNDESVHSIPSNYTPPIVTKRVKHPFKRLRTLISPEAGKTDATIEALFDDVKVGYYQANDDFSEIYIDETKWQNGELVREIDPVSGRLILKYASPNPVGITSFPYSASNNLPFNDPNSVNSIQADATLLNYDLRNNAYTRVRLGGRWYNDGSGTPGTDMTGDIWAEVALREDPSGIYGNWSVSRMTNASGTTATTLGSGNFQTGISVGTTYALYVGYDQASNQFTFRIGAEEVLFGPSGLPDRIRDPNSPWKAISDRVQINDDSSYGYVSAAFDNVLKNGALYDDFSSSAINPTRWTNYESVAEILSGKLRSKLRSSSASTSGSMGSNLNFLYPSRVQSIRAKVTPTSFDNSQGADVLARITQRVYHDDTPGTGLTGDIGGTVGIGGTGTNLEAQWLIFRMTDETGQNSEYLQTGTFSKTIVPGKTYTLFMAWNGSQFTFRIDAEEVRYTASGVINPVNSPSGSIGVRIKDPAGKEVMMEALFDDVRVNMRPPITDFDGDGKTDVAVYNKGSGWWFIVPSGGAPYGVGWGGDASDIPVSGDYDGDGSTDVAIYRGNTGVWWITPSSGAPAYPVGWGGPGYKPVPGDYDGDGKADIAIYETGTGVWWIIPSSGAPAYGVGWGGAGFTPVPADYDGDRKADIAIYGLNTGVWWIIPSSGAPAYGVGWGGAGYTALPADYDGDGKADIAIYESGTGIWWMIPSSGAPAYGVGWGGPVFTPVPGDYDGDEMTDIAIYEASTGAWWMVPSSGAPAYGVGWGGSPGDVPITANVP